VTKNGIFRFFEKSHLFNVIVLKLSGVCLQFSTRLFIHCIACCYTLRYSTSRYTQRYVIPLNSSLRYPRRANMRYILYTTLCYSTLLYATLRYSTLLDAIRTYSTLLDATRRYSTLIDATRLYSTLLYYTRGVTTMYVKQWDCLKPCLWTTTFVDDRTNLIHYTFFKTKCNFRSLKKLFY
jgi:hypothetical protein